MAGNALSMRLGSMLRPDRSQEVPWKELAPAVGAALSSFIVSLVLVLLFTYIYDSTVTLVWSVLALSASAALLPCFAPHGSPLAAMLLANVAVAATLGVRTYFVHQQPLAALLEGRSYSDVSPTLPSAAFVDASVLKFQNGTAVDQSKTMRWTSLDGGVSSYCVAPISNGNQGDRISFWSVGIDCCGKFSDFTCDRAGEPGVMGGVVLRDLQRTSLLYDNFGRYLVSSLGRRDHFLKAIELAEVTHGLSRGGDPVLVRWTGQARRQNVASRRRALILDMVMNVGVLLAISLVVFLVALRHGVMLTLVTQRDAKEAWDRGLPPETPFAVIEIIQERVNGTSTACKDLLIFGILIPVVVVVACTTMWSWAPCLKLSLAYTILAELSLLVLVGTLMAAPDKAAYGIIIMLVAMAGTYVGRRNFADSAFHFCTADYHRAYHGVHAESSAAPFADAGSVTFEHAAGVATDSSLGLLHQSTTYCVAPIVHCDSQASPVPAPAPAMPFAPAPAPPSVSSPSCGLPSSLSRVDFWAVGTDCCDSRGAFRCGRSLSANAHAGLVLRDSGADDWLHHDKTHRNLLRAVEAASDVHQLPVSENPLLLVWTDDLQASQEEWRELAMLPIIRTGIITAIVLTVTAATTVVYDHLQRRAEREKLIRM